jgi:hypothetical protein
MLTSKIFLHLTWTVAQVHALNITAYTDKDCLVEDQRNSIFDGRIDRDVGCSGVTSKRPTTAFKVADYGDWQWCTCERREQSDRVWSWLTTVYLIRAGSSTHQYTYKTSCNLGRDWIPESKNGTCYQYLDWDKYAIGNCTNGQAVDIWQQDRRDKHNSFLGRTIVGTVVGCISGSLLILGLVYWRRQRKRAKMQNHGKFEEVELSHHIRP